MKSIKKVCNSPKEMEKIAEKVIEILKRKNIQTILLFGEIGAGKTTLTKEIVKKINKNDTNKIKSPTYTYIQKHEGEDKTIYHIDMYRVKEQDKLIEAEISELEEEEKSIIIIEWAQFLKTTPKKTIKVEIEYLGDTSRNVTISY